MNKKIFIGILVGFCIACLSALSFATPQEDEAVEFYKAEVKKRSSCSYNDEYQKQMSKYRTKEVRRLEDSSLYTDASSVASVAAAGAFNAKKPTFFDVSELVIKDVTTKYGLVTINYLRKGHPEFTGEATLIKQDGVWKVEKDRMETKDDISQDDPEDNDNY